jgi:hypothetical protein
MLGTPFRHTLDDEVLELGDVHLDAAIDAKAPRARGRAVDPCERLLEPRIMRRVYLAVDEVSLLFHVLDRSQKTKPRLSTIPKVHLAIDAGSPVRCAQPE